MVRVSKTLTWNDCGVGRSHQAGIHIPKETGKLLFIAIPDSIKNPKITIDLSAFGDGPLFQTVITYYNSRKFGGTRDEYRLTHIRNFLKDSSLKPGDDIFVEIDLETRLGTISYKRQK